MGAKIHENFIFLCIASMLPSSCVTFKVVNSAVSFNLFSQVNVSLKRYDLSPGYDLFVNALFVSNFVL